MSHRTVWLLRNSRNRRPGDAGVVPEFPCRGQCRDTVCHMALAELLGGASRCPVTAVALPHPPLAPPTPGVSEMHRVWAPPEAPFDLHALNYE